ncbi:MAG: glycosyl transferase family 1 [Mucilaginibacter sp.]|nr:glycosyl transferase family 1 [Mucilaginibacter sp.]
MNLLHLIGSMNPKSGGPCQGIRNTTKEMETLGIIREVVCLDDPNESFLKEDFFPIEALGPVKNKWFYSPALIPWLLKNLNRFDVVILNGLWIYPGYALNKSLNILKERAKSSEENKLKVPKFFIMPHGMLDPYFQKAPSRKFKALRNTIYWNLIENKIILNADGLLFTCESELKLARESFHPYFPKKEINVGYGIQPPPAFTQAMNDLFLQKCPQLKNDNFLLFLSRIHEKKGIDLLLKAYNNVWTKKTTANLPKLVIAGPGMETVYGKKMEKFVHEHKLENQVFFSGMLSGPIKWGAFYASEAFILPSHQENFGIAVVEALACGKPVLISNQVNIYKEIENEGGGLVARDSLEGTQKLLENWFNLPIMEKKQMGEKAKVVYEVNFNIVNSTKMLVEAIS